MPPNEPSTVSPQTPPTSPQPQDVLPTDSSSPTPTPPPALTPSTPPTIPPKTHKSLMAVFLLIILVAVAFGAYYATRSTKPKTTSSSSTTVIVQPAALSPALVSITKAGFVPATIKVKVGQAVIWTNNDTASHLVASDPYPKDDTLPTFNSKQALAPHDSYSYVFNNPGTFTYHDDLNPYTLKGTVVVSKS